MKVSVCVISYNHEKYIAQCLESILMQECTFPFEIVIRDDCSQDQTLNIIKSYKKRYPETIKLVDAESNIGANRGFLMVFEKAEGKYCAICEGDDYWIDKEKLQKQANLMDAMPEVTFISHACRLHGQNGLGPDDYLKGTGVIEVTCNDVLEISGQFSPTASYMLRRDVVAQLPDWFKDAPVGDFFIEMYGIAVGKGLHLNEVLSAYRTFSENSWSTRNNEKQYQNMLKFSTQINLCLEIMRETPLFRKYNFSRKIAAVKFNTAIGSLLAEDFVGFGREIKECWTEVPNMSLTQNVLYRLRMFPRFARVLYILKRGHFFV